MCQDVTIFGVGVSDHVSKNDIEKLASQGFSFHVDKFEELKETFETLTTNGAANQHIDLVFFSSPRKIPLKSNENIPLRLEIDNQGDQELPKATKFIFTDEGNS